VVSIAAVFCASFRRGDGLAQAGHLHPFLARGILGGDGRARGRRGGGGRAAGAGDAAGADGARSTSSFMMRPSRPVPCT
jgi:hypothetical protein